MLDYNKLGKDFDTLLATYSTTDLVRFAEEEERKVHDELLSECIITESTTIIGKQYNQEYSGNYSSSFNEKYTDYSLAA